MEDFNSDNTPEAAELRRQRLSDLAANYYDARECRDHDQGNGKCGFFDSSDTYRADRAGQRGKF